MALFRRSPKTSDAAQGDSHAATEALKAELAAMPAGAPAKTPAAGSPATNGTTPHAEAGAATRGPAGNLGLDLSSRVAAARLDLAPDEAGGRVRPAEKLPDMAGTSISDDMGDMLQLLSEQAGLRFVRLKDFPKTNFTPDLLRMLPSETARAYKVFPAAYNPDTGTITIAISDPLNVRIVDDLRLFLMGANIRHIEPVVAHADEINDYINLHYGIGDKTLEQMADEFHAADESSGLDKAEGALDLSDLNKINEEGPVIRFCNLLLLQTLKDRGSDLHIEPFASIIRIRYRVDGVLREIPSPPKSWQNGILSRMKVVAGMDIAEMRRPQDGRMKLTIDGREVDCRMSTLPVVYGECLTMRLLDKSMMQVGVGQIGMVDDVLERFLKLIERPNGIMLVTGPTGSGKTTTLYAAINELNDPTEKIITTEDPVEYQLDGIVQVSVNPNVGLTFARCLRAILRQDPDVILVGEIRDAETAQIAVQAALTGHLVFSTLHTNSAAATISRLVDMGIEPFLITSCLAGIIAQRLVRNICQTCKVPYRPSAEELADFGTTLEEVADITFYRGQGCDECGQTGYRGRMGIFELLEATDEAKDLILERGTTDELHELALTQGMRTMRQDGWMKICLGLTTFDEVAKHTPKESNENIKKEMRALVEETVDEHMSPDDERRIQPTMGEIAGGPPAVGPASVPALPKLSPLPAHATDLSELGIDPEAGAMYKPQGDGGRG